MTRYVKCFYCGEPILPDDKYISESEGAKHLDCNDPHRYKSVAKPKKELPPYITTKDNGTRSDGADDRKDLGFTKQTFTDYKKPLESNESNE